MIKGKLACIETLSEVYRSHAGICLFTGAGVSWTQDEAYRAPGWERLLHEIQGVGGDPTGRQVAGGQTGYYYECNVAGVKPPEEM